MFFEFRLLCFELGVFVKNRQYFDLLGDLLIEDVNEIHVQLTLGIRQRGPTARDIRRVPFPCVVKYLVEVGV